jgi:hypothetical protein
VTLKAAVVDYGRSVLDKEWPRMKEEGKPVDDLQAFRSLTLAVMAPELTAAAPPAAHQAILSGLVESARHDVSASVYSPMRATQ